MVDAKILLELLETSDALEREKSRLREAARNGDEKAIQNLGLVIEAAEGLKDKLSDAMNATPEPEPNLSVKPVEEKKEKIEAPKKMGNREVEALARYNRQNLIVGWDQSRLEKSRVVILGTGNLANFTSSSLVALGIGNVEIYDNSKYDGNRDGEFLLFEATKGESKAKALEKMLGKINPLSRVKGVDMKLERSPLISIVGKPDLIIDLTNSPGSKSTVEKYAKAKGIDFISASTDPVRGEFYVIRKGEEDGKAGLEAYLGKPQGAVASEIVAGMITEETRKILMPINGETPVKHLGYSLGAERRFSDEVEKEPIQKDLKGKRILIVGAGGLGTPVSLGAALAGIGEIDILDYDEVDSTNLNRQILFYDAVGKKKSEALAERVGAIAPNIKVNGIVGKLDENSDYFSKNKYDLIFDCVDSFAVRALINYFAVKHKIPLVSGGTNPNSGQVSVYVPGETSCLDCKLGVDKALAKARVSSSCRYAPDPSVIMTNEIIGGMMVGEARKVLDRDYGEPVHRVLKYDSTAKSRGGLVGVDGKCDCTRPEADVWLKDIIDKYKAGGGN